MSKFRLITRPDFDGVVSGALLQEREMIGDVVFAEPNEMQAGPIPVSDNDITANLPYNEDVRLCFDHHLSESERVGERDNLVIDTDAPSAARVIFDHFGGKEGFPLFPIELMSAVDKADSADYSEEEILAPADWTLINFVADPRTGLSRFGHFDITNDQLMIDLMTYCRRHEPAEILEIPDVEERVHLFLEHGEYAELQIRKNARVEGSTIIVYHRDEETIYACNRFMVYALYPQCNLSIHVNPMEDKERVEIAMGKSIIDRSSTVNVGSLMLKYGGGGHQAVGTCRVSRDEADTVLSELIAHIGAA
ncbi:MAG: exopolyphosphatase [Rhodospirillaceae bacterium]|nr:exopolyphosphatase [Rhodospirillaceae bacterium]